MVEVKWIALVKKDGKKRIVTRTLVGVDLDDVNFQIHEYVDLLEEAGNTLIMNGISGIRTIPT